MFVKLGADVASKAVAGDLHQIVYVGAISLAKAREGARADRAFWFYDRDKLEGQIASYRNRRKLHAYKVTLEIRVVSIRRLRKPRAMKGPRR